MGTTESKQNLGERVMAARKKLEEDKQLQSERVDELVSKAPSTTQYILTNIEASLATYSPFLEHALLVAWKTNAEQCKKVVLEATRKVLSAPILDTEYEWLKKYVLPSSIWMFESAPKRFMYQELMSIVDDNQFMCSK